ncbi:hypothetical protein [Pseudaquabacterium pictum]|uniref:Uncharacterized protein n=1 Tax=Pseudaquabacterium pictum TaxID=2315236 RepID=A0A480B2K5_9BURK|nr:hypothetical protein [Rubrivivax pictus]GCL66125.1 hypothetical protein AQPW35_52060 [Rubrivivax pictus]
MTTIDRDLQRLMTAVAELPAPEIKPDIRLCNWRLVQIHDRPGARPFRRLVGRRYSEGYPVVGLLMSSPVEHIDLARRLATTHSGSVYELVGQPGLDDAELNWIGIVGLGGHKSRDLTPALQRLMRRRS